MNTSKIAEQIHTLRYSTDPFTPHDANEAADTIEALTAENTRLRDTNKALESDNYNLNMNLEHTTAENAELREAQRWIAVEERLPEDDKTASFYSDGRLTFTSVLCVTHGLISIRNRLNVKPTGTPYLDDQVTDGWVWGTGDEPTHWRKLPEPPQKG